MTQWFHSQLYTQEKWKHMSTQKLGYEWVLIAVLLIIAPKVETTQKAHPLMCTPISIQWNIIRLSKGMKYCPMPQANNRGKYSVCTWSLSPVPLFANPWTVTHQALLSMEFSRQEYWSRLPFPTPSNLYLLHLLYWQVDSLPPAPLGWMKEDGAIGRRARNVRFHSYELPQIGKSIETGSRLVFARVLGVGG